MNLRLSVAAFVVRIQFESQDGLCLVDWVLRMENALGLVESLANDRWLLGWRLVSFVLSGYPPLCWVVLRRRCFGLLAELSSSTPGVNLLLTRSWSRTSLVKKFCSSSISAAMMAPEIPYPGSVPMSIGYPPLSLKNTNSLVQQFSPGSDSNSLSNNGLSLSQSSFDVIAAKVIMYEVSTSSFQCRRGHFCVSIVEHKQPSSFTSQHLRGLVASCEDPSMMKFSISVELKNALTSACQVWFSNITSSLIRRGGGLCRVLSSRRGKYSARTNGIFFLRRGKSRDSLLELKGDG